MYRTHKEIVQKISDDLGIEKKVINSQITSFFNFMLKSMRYHRIIIIKNFGKFTLNSRGRRMKKRSDKVIDINTKAKHIIYNNKRKYRDT